MTVTARMVFLILAAICFALGAAGVAARLNWDQAGKACVVLAFIFP